MNKIKNFLIINCTGKDDCIGLKTSDNFVVKKLDRNIKNNDIIVSNILDFIRKNNVKINNKFSIIVNIGPGSFSSIRAAIAVTKGIKISTQATIYGYNNNNLSEFNLKNIEFLIKNNLLENKLIKPVYMS
jgi:tRNA A37 threonylcarbamoyladenosine modification protein TsaB